jgi:hypothetical protein
MLRLTGSWLWDLWLADDGQRYHVASCPTLCRFAGRMAS